MDKKRDIASLKFLYPGDIVCSTVFRYWIGRVIFVDKLGGAIVTWGNVHTYETKPYQLRRL